MLRPLRRASPTSDAFSHELASGKPESLPSERLPNQNTENLPCFLTREKFKHSNNTGAKVRRYIDLVLSRKRGVCGRNGSCFSGDTYSAGGPPRWTRPACARA